MSLTVSTILFLTLVVIAAASVTDSEWKEFKSRHGKRYGDVVSEKHRRSAYTKNKEKIRAHNELFRQNKTTFEMGVNQFTDMTYEEFAAVMLQNQEVDGTASRAQNQSTFLGAVSATLAATVDWRQSGYVTAVKNQGQCGSCWAFGAVGSLEGQNKKKTGQLISLSEQNLVDCATQAYGNYGCGGGNLAGTFNYIISNGGIDTTAYYPYTALDGTCRYSLSGRGATCNSYTRLPINDEAALQQAVATIGPISACFYVAQSFQNYKSGIYYGADCPTQGTNHCITIVGYGTEGGLDYWLVKNSWGTGWGEAGYIRMSRNRNNNCQIAYNSGYPVL